jgi:hypothetical protein
MKKTEGRSRRIGRNHEKADHRSLSSIMHTGGSITRVYRGLSKKLNANLATLVDFFKNEG